MTQVPLLKGTYTDADGDYRTSYPRNRIPVPQDNGISQGYFRPAPGIVQFSEGPGRDRGGIEWNGICYRVMGRNLVRVDPDGVTTILGDVGPGGQVSLDYSFEYLMIISGRRMYLYDGSELRQNTDPDLGPVFDGVWLDGYFVGVDGEFIVVTELTDPFSVNPVKYGSSEIDPDPIVAVVEINNEIAAVNRYTIEFFDNVGGEADQFPFRRNDGAQVMRGAIGTHAVTVFQEAIAFIGSGNKENEALAIWLGVNGRTSKLSDREIDKILESYTEAQLSLAILETRRQDDHENLYVHLPDQTLVYDAHASRVMQRPVWHTEDSGLTEPSRYRGFNFVRAYGKWICGDPTSSNVGVLTDEISSHYGECVAWELSTMIIFGQATGFIVHEIELTGLTGRQGLGLNPIITTSHSNDGETWSQPKAKRIGTRGDRKKQISWRRQGRAERQRIQRFNGTSDDHLTISRVDFNVESLGV